MASGAMTWEEAVLWLREQEDQSELVKACYYDDPLLDVAQRYYQSGEWKALRRFLPASGGTALDIGSGRGISAYSFAMDGWRTSALEPDPSDIVGAGAIRMLAASACLDIEVHETWGECLPFGDREFDLVHCRAVMHHARNLGGFMLEVARVLRPGGVFLGLREHVVSHHRDIPEFLARHPLHALYGGEHAYLVSEYELAIERAGLHVTHRLNPLESDINLWPLSRLEVKSRIAKKVGLSRFASWIPDSLLRFQGERTNDPGRLYTFIATKHI